MRVLVVVYKIAANEGSESGSGYNFVRELSRRVDDLTIITRRDQAAELSRDAALGHVRVVGLDVPKFLAFWKKGSRGVIPYYYLWQLFVGAAVKRMHEAQPFDVVHQYNFHTDWAPHFLRAPGARIIWGPICHQPVVPRGYMALESWSGRAREYAKATTKRAFWHLDPLLRLAIRRSDVILYANPDLAPPFRRSHNVRQQTFGGSDLRTGTCAPEGGDLYLIHVGRQVSIKGPSVALEALAATREPSHLEIVGDGPLHDALRRYTDELGIGSRVTFTPWLSRDELSARYARADAILYPTLANQDTVVAEALHAGLPVIGVRAAGTLSMVGASDTLLVPLGNHHRTTTNRLAAAIDRAARLKQTGGLGQLAEASRSRAEEISWPATTDAIVECYR